MAKKFFAAHHAGKVYFRGSNGNFAFNALVIRDGGDWGFTTKGRAPDPKAAEIDKATYAALLAAKKLRTDSNSPTSSWCDATALPPDVLAKLEVR